MNTVVFIEDNQSLGQTNGETFHARSNREKKPRNRTRDADSDRKLAETLLLLSAIIDEITAEAGDSGATCIISEEIARRKHKQKHDKEKHHGSK